MDLNVKIAQELSGAKPVDAPPPADTARESWIPLEANPEVFNAWSEKLGLATETDAFQDVYGLDPELLAMVPQPAKALLLLFPVSEEYERARKEEAERIRAEGQPELDRTLTWFPQRVGNACGTIGLLHALANTQVTLTPTSPLAQFFIQARELSPAARVDLLNRASFLRTAHAASASAGQTAPPEPGADVDLHFVAFVQAPAESVREREGGGLREGEAERGGLRLIELDGRKEGPVDHGPSTDLLNDAAKVIREKFINTSPDSMQFALVALAPPPED